MEEVDRTDDLELGRPVALKFLPAGLEHEESRLHRFLDEARHALSHANVWAVHDIGEVDGQHFISMKYVDGENLPGRGPIESLLVPEMMHLHH